MDCYYCHTPSRKFYCRRCLREKLDDHHSELQPTYQERDAAIQQANAFVDKAKRIQSLVAEKNRRAAHMDHLLAERELIAKDTEAVRQQIMRLRQQVQRRRVILEAAEQRQRDNQALSEIPVEIQNARKRWQRTHKMIVSARRVFVSELVSLFEFKPGVVDAEEIQADEPDTEYGEPEQAQSSSSPIPMPFAGHRGRVAPPEDLYICRVTLPTRLIDVSKYSKEELNATIGYLIHMLGLIVRYIGIKLPFMIQYRGIYPYIKSSSPRSRQNRMPLFLDDKNLRRFTVGMAMLNYDIAYLCQTQGVDIPLPQVTNTLQALMSLCRAPNLGVKSHATLYEGLKDMEPALEFQQVLRLTLLRFRSGIHSTTDISKELIREGAVHDGDDWYFYDGMLDNSDDDIQDDEEEEHGVDAQSENWNLVDVMPSFGRPNGEGEGMFHLGATIMPGVLGMMESLGGRHVLATMTNRTPQSADANRLPTRSTTRNPTRTRRHFI